MLKNDVKKEVSAMIMGCFNEPKIRATKEAPKFGVKDFFDLKAYVGTSSSVGQLYEDFMNMKIK